jgi:(1->4)-alpha-D-glucan 1-alpha-D-glucosylmutase
MLATSTHDNKRSEDVRTRIDVISELVAEWRLQLRKWHRMNLDRKPEVDGMPAPSRNDEYLLYQVLLGSYPVMPAPREELDAYTERIVAYMQKGLREAKQRTSWANVNEPYEQATEKFVRTLLEERPGNAFLEDMRAAAAVVTWIGFLNSLSMVTVKLTSPGVPDTYQGNELFDFSLVDPDNRRPVDYALREKALAAVEALGDAPGDKLATEVLANIRDGRSKLYVLWRLLQLRKSREQLYTVGTYTAVRTSGEKGKHVVAFARRAGSEVGITVAPRLLASLGVRQGQLPCDAALWGGTRIEVPFVKDGTTLRNVMTGEDVVVERGGIDVGPLFARFPTAVLVG